MKNKYFKIINLLIKEKYKDCKILNKEFLKFYIKGRLKLKNEISKKKVSYFQKRGSTYSKTLGIYKKKKISKAEINFIINMYKRFEIHLFLKENYNQLVKNSNKKSSLITAFLIKSILERINFLNSVQKLNFYLKLNDQLYFFNEKINYFEKKLILKSLENEKKLFQKFY